MVTSDKLLIVQSPMDSIDDSSEDPKSFEQFNPELNNADSNDESELLECSHCHKKQPITEFYNVTNYWMQKRGCTYRCRTCCRESARISAAERRKERKDETVLPS